MLATPTSVLWYATGPAHATMASFFTVWRFDLWKCARGNKTCLVLPCRRLALKLHAQVRFYKVRYLFIYLFSRLLFSEFPIFEFPDFPIFQTYFSNPLYRGGLLVERGDALMHFFAAEANKMSGTRRCQSTRHMELFYRAAEGSLQPTNAEGQPSPPGVA